MKFDETTFVRVKDASRVAVGVSQGGEWLMPADGLPATKELPASNPPFREGTRLATVTRERGGQVVLDCPNCKDHRQSTVVPSSKEIALVGVPAENTKWEAGQLDMRFSHRALFPCDPHPTSDCPREAIALSLSTPRSNIEEIVHKRSVATREVPGAWLGAIFGGVIAAGGLGLAGAYAFDSEARKPVTLVLAAAVAGMGAAFMGMGISTLRARGTEEVIYRAP